METFVTGHQSTHHLLSRSFETCPTLNRPRNPLFIRLWQTEIDIPYAAEESQLLPALFLNRQVAAYAEGPDGEAYRKKAGLNVTRLMARLGADFDGGEGRIVENDPDELGWLEWCRWRVRGDREECPLPGWTVSTESWKPVREACEILEAGSANALTYLSRQADPPGTSNTPLAYVRQLLRLTEAERLLAEEKFAEAKSMAVEVGPSGERIALLCDRAVQSDAEPDDATRIRIRYHAYAAGRQAQRHRVLGFHASARYWDLEHARWSALNGNGTSSDASEGSPAEELIPAEETIPEDRADSREDADVLEFPIYSSVDQESHEQDILERD